MSAEPYGGNVGDLLLRDGLVSDAILNEALKRQRQTSRPLGQILVEMNAITETVKLNFFKKHFGHGIISLKDVEIPDLLFTYIPRQLAVTHRVVPVKLQGDTLTVAVEDPSDLILIDNLKIQVGMRVKPMIASAPDIERVLETYPGSSAVPAGEMAARYVPQGVGSPLTKRLFFPVATFAPLAVLILLLLLVDRVQMILLHPPVGLSTTDMVLGLVLLWGLWALLVYEIDGIFFNPEPPPARKRQG